MILRYIFLLTPLGKNPKTATDLNNIAYSVVKVTLCWAYYMISKHMYKNVVSILFVLK